MSSAGHAQGEAHAGARRRLKTRIAAAQVRLGHDYIDTVNAARRRKHPDKQDRLIGQLRAEIAALKRLVSVAPSDSLDVRHPTRLRRAGRMAREGKSPGARETGRGSL